MLIKCSPIFTTVIMSYFSIYFNNHPISAIKILWINGLFTNDLSTL
jgi:hypothetical protein